MANKEFVKNLEKRISKIEDIVGNGKFAQINTRQLQGELKDVNKKIEELKSAMQDAKLAAESSVFVGLLGRYSHGKSALANALFELNETGCELPVGDTIVTSKVTFVSFDKEAKSPMAKEQPANRMVTWEELRKEITSDDNGSLAAYYDLIIPAYENSEFSIKFADKNICLMDMPGLGGTKFNDKALTRDYIQDADLLIVTIKIDEIEESARHVRSFIEKVNVPLIPVLTYSDHLDNPENDLYSDCESKEDMLDKAKELVKGNFPSLINKADDDLIAVSAYTKENIDALRNLILGYVERKAMKTRNTDGEVSAVFRKKNEKMNKVINKVRVKAAETKQKFEELLEILAPNRNKVVSYDNVFRNYNNEYKRLIRACKDCIDEEEMNFEDRVKGISKRNTKDDVQKEADCINDYIEKKLKGNLLRSLEEALGEYKSEIKPELQNLVNELHISESEKRDRKDRIEKDINNFTWDQILEENDKEQLENLIQPLETKNKFDSYNKGTLYETILTFFHLRSKDRTRLDRLKSDLEKSFIDGFNTNKMKDVVVECLKKVNNKMTQKLEDLKSYNKDIEEIYKIEEKFCEELEGLEEDLKDYQRNC